MKTSNKNSCTASEAETLELGRKIGEAVQGGEIILLIGPMGARKSVLAKGIARGMGVDGQVRSPSFNLMREYNARLTLKHWDLYRLEGGYGELGLLDTIDDDSVVIVEWAERWESLRKSATGVIYIDYGVGETDRVISMEGKIPGLND